MEIMTADGIRIYCLPDNAKCKLTGENPCDMDECPSHNYSMFGYICVPELCGEYTEGDK